MKFREVRISLNRKGFRKIEGAKHERYYFPDANGEPTGITTILSRARGSKDVNPSLQSSMARQMRLSNDEFRQFVDCSLSEAEYVKKLGL